ncbi:MAG TPA: hypothetical protein VLD61_05080 [Methylomirabilota bacterium]|nr:hypothetical protein [Methylomirabilota bacterium]
MTDSKTVMAWHDNEWPDWPTADGQPTTGAKSYGGIVGQIPPPDTLPDEKEEQPDPDPAPEPQEQPETDEPRLRFPGESDDLPPDIAAGADTPPEVNAQSPNAGQPPGEDQGPEHSTGY